MYEIPLDIVLAVILGTIGVLLSRGTLLRSMVSAIITNIPCIRFAFLATGALTEISPLFGSSLTIIFFLILTAYFYYGSRVFKDAELWGPEPVFNFKARSSFKQEAAPEKIAKPKPEVRQSAEKRGYRRVS